MALKALKCPNCDANIQVDDDRDYGFCSYCGAQVQVKETVKIELSEDIEVDRLIDGIFEKKIEDGKALLKLGEYYKADQVFARLVRENPGRPEAYAMRIRSLTRDHTVFISGTQSIVMQQADMMLKVAPEDEKDYYTELKQKLEESYEQGIREQQEREKSEDLIKTCRLLKEAFVMLFLALFFAFFGFGQKLSVITAAAVLFAVAITVGIILLWARRNSLLKQQDEESSMLEEFMSDIAEEFFDA